MCGQMRCIEGYVWLCSSVFDSLLPHDRCAGTSNGIVVDAAPMAAAQRSASPPHMAARSDCATQHEGAWTARTVGWCCARCWAFSPRLALPLSLPPVLLSGFSGYLCRSPTATARQLAGSCSRPTGSGNQFCSPILRKRGDQKWRKSPA